MNKHFNRILSLLAVLALTLALLTGCGQQTQQSQNETQDTTASDTQGTDAGETDGAAAADPAQEAGETEATTDGGDQQAVKHITLTVTYEDETSQEYTFDTTAEYLKEAIEDEVELGGSEGEFGFYIESVNGVTADYDTDGAYWAIYVNDEYGMYGIDAQPVTDGDHYALVYTVG